MVSTRRGADRSNWITAPCACGDTPKRAWNCCGVSHLRYTAVPGVYSSWMYRSSAAGSGWLIITPAVTTVCGSVGPSSAACLTSESTSLTYTARTSSARTLVAAPMLPASAGKATAATVLPRRRRGRRMRVIGGLAWTGAERGSTGLHREMTPPRLRIYLHTTPQEHFTQTLHTLG